MSTEPVIARARGQLVGEERVAGQSDNKYRSTVITLSQTESDAKLKRQHDAEALKTDQDRIATIRSDARQRTRAANLYAAHNSNDNMTLNHPSPLHTTKATTHRISI